MDPSEPSPDHHARVKRLFLEALERSPDERGTWLEERAIDAETRDEVLELLEHHLEEVEVSDPGTDPTDPTGPVQDAGRTIAGRYRILGRIGEGGMAEVFRARDLVLDQIVALKLIRGSLDRKGHDLARNEVRLARQVTHPNVCRVYDVGQDGNSLFLTMELVEGEDLGSLLRKVGRLPQDKVLDLARQLCAGLAAAHGRGILHRDLKPGNVLVDERGRVKITDFGIAVPNDGGAAVRAGTPAWMAPELLRGVAASEQSDLYALALVLYQMLLGRRPRGPSRNESGPAPAIERATGVDPGVEDALLVALHPDPTRRPRSVLAFAASLPGCDALGMATEAGVTPPPEVVLASGDARRTWPARVALTWGVVAWLLLLGNVGLADRWGHLAGAGVDRPPDYLAESVGDLLRNLGHPEPEDRAWGFVDDIAPDFRGSPILFWYREAPTPMAPRDVENLFWGGAQVDLVDPPLVERGMVLALTDGQGRLLELESLARDETEAGGDAARGKRQVLEGPGLFEAVGADPETVRSTGTKWIPRVWGDDHRAWIAADPREASREIRIEAVAAGETLVWIRVEVEGDAEPEEPPLGRWDLASGLEQILLLLCLCACVPIALRHVRSGRSDVQGTLRLVVVILGLRLLQWILTASHLPLAREESLLLLGSTALFVLEALTFGVAYLALEPFVRRDSPRTLVGWRRALAGKWNDAIVGRGLLVGAVAGPLLSMLALADARVTEHLTQVSWAPLGMLLWPAVKARYLVATLIEVAIVAAYGAILALLVLVAVRRVWGKRRFASLFFVGLASLYYGLEGDHPWASWWILGLGIACVVYVLLTRFGLMSLVVAFWINLSLSSVPLTFRADAWYATTGWLAVVVAALVALLGARAAGDVEATEVPRDFRADTGPGS